MAWSKDFATGAFAQHEASIDKLIAIADTTPTMSHMKSSNGISSSSILNNNNNISNYSDDISNNNDDSIHHVRNNANTALVCMHITTQS